jgi:hypothetical protein
MHGFGSHAYSFINANMERFWVKFHFVTQQGIQNLTDAEAAEITGQDREYHQRDLFESIERGDFPRWKLCVQIMPEAEASKVPYHPFDLTKIWPKKDYPLIEVGVLELNRNPDNFSPKSNRHRSRRRRSCPASVSRPTRCCRAVCSRTATPRAIAGRESSPDSGELAESREVRQQLSPRRPMRVDGNRAAPSPTSPIRRASGPSNPTSANRR